MFQKKKDKNEIKLCFDLLHLMQLNTKFLQRLLEIS